MMEFLDLPDDVALADRGRDLLRARTAGAGRVHAVARPFGACSSASSRCRWRSTLGRGSTSSSPSRCFALASIPLWRRFARRVEKPVDQPFLNRRADAFVGREFTLEKPIVAGNGTVKIDDTIWRLSGPDVPGGSRVKVVRADAATLVVEAVKHDPKWAGFR